jgi:hypothetical protein
MSRNMRLWTTYALAAAGVAGLFFLSACGISSPFSAGGTARLNVLMTDAPSDDWSVVQVTITSVSLRNVATRSWVNVWGPGTQSVNLVDYSGVNGFLAQNANIEAGTYDGMKLTIDPTSFVLTDSNTPSNTYSGSNVTVVDPSGKGEIKVEIRPAVTLSSSTTDVESLGLDFDLAHPLSIIVQNGKAVINLQVRHKAIPRNLKDIQFARSLGVITAADAANPTTFSIHTLEGGDLTFGVDQYTKYVDVDHPDQTADFAGLAELKDTTGNYTSTYGALVASNMNSDGTLYAREVWYGTLTALPQFTPEGVVRAVGDNWIKVLNKNATNSGGAHMSCRWDSDVIYVTDDTTWTFHNDTSVQLPKGKAMLTNIRRGFRVTVTLDTTKPTKTALSVNIQSAHDEGVIRSVDVEKGVFTFGGPSYHDGWNCGPSYWQHFSHEWLFSDVSGHLFSWWFYGMTPAATTDPATLKGVIDAFAATVQASQGANLRVFAWAELYWEGDATGGQWAAENVIFAPEKLPGATTITTGYIPNSDPATGGSMVVSTFDWDNDSLPTSMTVNLDPKNQPETVVGSLVWNSETRILTFTVPVPPGQWATLLMPSPNLMGVRVWVRPVGTTSGDTTTWAWYAYAVIAYQIVTN